VTPKRSERINWGDFAGDIVIFQQLSKQYIVLNSTARRIFELSDGRRSAKQIAEHLCEEFEGLPENVEQEVLQTIEGLRELGVLQC
jgi:hypothetical protein